ncbi:MAG: hypothetical protein GY810_15040 [Aureispira sp.]|nr:hypothetical protein [Aureispira sp.]
MKSPFIFICIALFLTTIGYGQEEYFIPKHIDMSVSSTKRAFDSRKTYTANIWESREYKSHNVDIHKAILNSYKYYPKNAQSSLENLVTGNVKISNQVIAAPERNLFHNVFLRSGTRSAIYESLTGLAYKEDDFILNNINHFNEVINHIVFLKDQEPYSHAIEEQVQQYQLLKSAKDVDQVMQSDNTLGMVLSIKGGHSLSNFLFIEQQQTETPEFKNFVFSNIDKLKGIQFIDDCGYGGFHLKVPIFSMSFDNYYYAGICGKSNELSNAQSNTLPKLIEYEGFSALGKKVVARLLDNNKGHRILIDISGIDRASKNWYYEHLSAKANLGDIVPILASHVGIEGVGSELDKRLEKKSLKKLPDNMADHHRKLDIINSSDIQKIIESKGLIGLSLDRDQLMNASWQLAYYSQPEGSAERRDVAIKAIVANLCTVAKLNTKAPWSNISISSNFDNWTHTLDVYASSEDMTRLATDLLTFFEAPKDIDGYFSSKEIQRLMGNYSAQEIVEKVMYSNALEFIKANLPKE